MLWVTKHLQGRSALQIQLVWYLHVGQIVASKTFLEDVEPP